MSGRHGRLSGSPFHVISKRDLAGEKFDCSCREEPPECIYRKNQICYLPQNKLSYKKRCICFKCKYVGGKQGVTKERKNCIYAYGNTCLYNLLLNNCNRKNDLAFCCDYFVSVSGNESLAKKIKDCHECQVLLEKVRKLKRQFKKAVDDRKRKELLGEIKKYSKEARGNSEFRNVIQQELSNKIDCVFGFEKQDVILLRKNKITTYMELLRLENASMFELRDIKNRPLSEMKARRFLNIRNLIEEFYLLR